METISADIKEIKILLVEDKESDAYILKKQLSNSARVNYSIDHVLNLKDALSTFASKNMMSLY